MRFKQTGIVLLLMILVVYCGCSRNKVAGTLSNPAAADTEFAKQIANAVSMNSSTAVQASFGGSVQSQIGAWMPRVSQQLSRFGTVSNVELESGQEQSNSFSETVWKVSATQGSYEMKMALSNGVVRHLEFRTASDKPWTHVMEVLSNGAVIQ